MTTLFNALLETAQLCGVLRYGVSTSTGTTTTLIDAVAYENDDYYNNGTLFIRSGTFTDTTNRITDYVSSTGTFTFSDAYAGVVPGGVFYSVSNASRESLVQAINAALTTMGEYTIIDATTTVTNNATEYTLPTGVSNIKRVEVYSSTTQPHQYFPLPSWREMDGKIYLPDEMEHASGNTIRIYYNKYHSAVNRDIDVIRADYNLKRLAWTATYMFMMNRMQYSGNTDNKENWMLTNAQQQAERLANVYPVKHIEKDAMLARW